MRILLLLPALLCLPACDKAEDKPKPVAPAAMPPPKPLPRPAAAGAESTPAPSPAVSVETPPAPPPPPPPTPKEMEALQSEVKAVLELGAPLLEGGEVENAQALRVRVIDLFKRRGKLVPGMSPEQRAEVAKQFAPVLQLRDKLNPPSDLVEQLLNNRPAVPGPAAGEATEPAPGNVPPPGEQPPAPPDNSPPQ
jgi:hypothetical protein